MTKRNYHFSIFALAIILVVGFFALKQFQDSNPDSNTANIQGMVIPEPAPVNPFSLNQTNGKKFTEQNLRGHWSVLFFGYTYCPDICPTTLATLNHATSLIQAQSKADDTPIDYLFVSVDPERDDLQRLQEYVTYFNQDFIGLTGNDTQIESLARQFGVPYLVQKPDDKHPEYIVDHGSMLIVINPRGEYQAVLTAPHTSESLAHDLTSLRRVFG